MSRAAGARRRQRRDVAVGREGVMTDSFNTPSCGKCGSFILSLPDICPNCVDTLRAALAAAEAENAALRERVARLEYGCAFALRKCGEYRTRGVANKVKSELVAAIGDEAIDRVQHITNLIFAAEQALYALEEGYDAPKVRDDLKAALTVLQRRPTDAQDGGPAERGIKENADG